tara:strand:+ start:1358 stop:1747 length:390 start_codon:yes stop_codon:yes gene_type:complete
VIEKKIKLPSNRNFGYVFCLVFLLISVWPILDNGQIRIWSSIITILFFILGSINSNLLTPLNKLWFKFGIFLGKIISPIVMMIIFFGIVTPIGLIMKLLKKDILNLKFNSNSSYWIKRINKKTSMKQRF